MVESSVAVLIRKLFKRNPSIAHCWLTGFVCIGLSDGRGSQWRPSPSDIQGSLLLKQTVNQTVFFYRSNVDYRKSFSLMLRLNAIFSRNERHYLRERQEENETGRFMCGKRWNYPTPLEDFHYFCKEKYIISTKHLRKWLVLPAPTSNLALLWNIC